MRDEAHFEDEVVRIERARAATGDELTALVEDSSEDVLAEVLANPALSEAHLILLLERKGLPARILERIAKTREWMRSYPVKKRVAIHPRTPRLLALPMLRQLYLFDLVEASLLPSTTAEAKRVAEELILAKLPQLPLGQKLTLAKRGAGRIAAALLLEGHAQLMSLAIDNAFLTEAHVLRVLARDDLPDGVAAALAGHRKWSHLPQVRVALVRNPSTPLARVLGFLPDLTLSTLRDLVELQSLSSNLREYLRHEMEKRTRRLKAT